MTKHKHEKHIHCEHEEVAFCGHCDVAYCKSCKQEWGECKMQHYPHYWYSDTPTVPAKPYWTPTCTTTGTLDISNDIHTAHAN